MTLEMWASLLLLAVGVALGAGWREIHDKTSGEVKKAKRDEMLAEKDDEIKRLREQVARVVGTEYCRKCHIELVRKQQQIPRPVMRSTCCSDATHGCMAGKDDA